MKLTKYIKIKSLFFILCCMNSLLALQNDQTDTSNFKDSSNQEIADIVFKYDNEPLENIINKLAAEKDINVIFPAGEIPTIKVSLNFEQKLTLSQAWDLLNTLLDVAGFCIVPQGNLIRIVKNNKEIYREPMPTYIGVSPDQLPNNDQQIRYLYYLSNLRVSDDQLNEINGILKDLLPENAWYKGDTVTNGLLIIAKANDIRSAMNIIINLDQVNFQEKVDILPLQHTSAAIVARLVNEELIKQENANPYRLDTKKAKEAPYFSGFTKVIAEPRLNKLILLGRPQAIERLKDFIRKYIDVAPETGKSILHVYRLQYLDAQSLAPVLQQIVQGGQAGGPSQASAGESTGGGVERFFDKVIIYTDSPLDIGRDSANTSGNKTVERFTYYGGNNLVIAARNDDWKQIKKLIEDLDIPQRQVLIEVLIADLTIEDSRLLGSMTRIPDKVPLPDSMEFQSAQFGQPIPTELPATPTTNLDANLLSNAYATGTNPPTLANPLPADANANLADFVQSGTTMLSLNDNDGKTWSIWELLQLFTSTKILSHPHIIARNNKEATVSIGEERVLVDTVKDVASNYYGGATTIQYKKIPANLTVKITPRISHEEDTVNLQVFIDISAYESASASNNTILKRFLQTNANIKSGGIFALGGLIRTTNTNTVSETPLLGKIPIIGWFFKRKSKNVQKNNLTVFISPTIIEPRLRSGINEYTDNYIDIAKEYSQDALFDSLKDPITRWFFREKIDTATVMDKFVEKNEAAPALPKKRKKNKKIKSLALAHETSSMAQDIETPQDFQDEPIKTVVLNANDLAASDNENKLDNLKKMLQSEPNPFLKV